MMHQEFEIVNKLGLHARAAAKLVQCASGFDSRIDIERNGQRVSAKSIMGVMMLAASQGTRVRVHAEGEDAETALRTIGALIGERFGEPE
ncbi:MAG: HPr family phosphocarrier protein [Chromatiaceae bacterium]|nr:HPr family phosphocarrier protein [Chromatiaceae bacterium]